MKIENIFYNNVAVLYNRYAEARKQYELSQQANLTPFRVLRDINLTTSELDDSTGIEVKDPTTYLIYITKIEEVSESNYEPSPYWLNESIAISTYEQFKLYILRTNPWDFYNSKNNKLTYLAHFVEEFLDRELNSSGKKHLIDVLKQLELDLRINQSNFWERIKEKLTIIPSRNVNELIQDKLDKVKDFIDRSFAGKQEFCLDWQAFKAHEEAIITDLEVQLTEGSYKYINSPQLFLTTTQSNSQQFNNSVGFDNVIGSNNQQEKKNGKDWTLPQEQIENSDTYELPLKSEVAENINQWGGQRAFLTKDQQSKSIKQGPKVNELDHFNESSVNNTQTSDNNKTDTGNSNNLVSQESFNVALLNWMDGLIERYLNHEEILEKLEKHFVYAWVIGC